MVEQIKDQLRAMVRARHLRGWYTYSWGGAQWCVLLSDATPRTFDTDGVLAYIDMWRAAND